MKFRRRRVLQALGTLPFLASGFAFADRFPSRLVRIIVPASPGTSIDAITRFFADPLSKGLGVPVIVENRPGAGGLLGYREAARSPADGYTLILTGIPLYLLPILSDSNPPPFDPVKDFTPIARVARVPFAIVVSVESPYRTLADLIEAMRNEPGKVTYSSQGVGSSAHLCSAILNDMTKTQALHIGYKQTSMATMDVAGGRVSFTCQTSTGVLPLIKGGKLRALAVTGSQHWDALPEIPTVHEAGVPGFEVSSQLDFMAPAGLPREVADGLTQHIERIARTPEFRQFCNDQVLTLEVLGGAELAPEISKEFIRWQRVARLAQAG
jgi:tripartite-type tricarboxylate transporter receptor subunit TctC